LSRKHLSSLLLPAAALSATLTVSAPSLASLGGDVASVSADRAVIAGELRTISLIQYDQHEITRGTLVVREYVTRQGQVFAVTWRGPVPPDLRQLLGEYFPRFQAAATSTHASRPGMHRYFSLAQPDLVIEQSGRLRDFHGVAYLPLSVPAGVSLDQLQ
jgi:hypothetical protein